MSIRRDFINDILQCGEGIAFFLNKMPLDSIESYKKDTDGRFTVGFSSSKTATLTHDDPKIAKSMEGSIFKINKVVTGKIDQLAKTVTLDKGGIEVSYSLLSVSVTSIKEVDLKTTELTGKWALFSKSAQVPNEVIMFTKVNWQD